MAKYAFLYEDVVKAHNLNIKKNSKKKIFKNSYLYTMHENI